jgi:succinate-semialdehyde dehydrogenase/glutarate-semialdehyde dehydrogenase
MPFIATNPATGQVIASYPSLGDAELASALEQAHCAYTAWRTLSFSERALYMTRAAELLESEIPVIAQLMTEEMGKTFAAAKGEAAKCAFTLRYFAERAEAMLAPEVVATTASRSGVRFDPIGVIFGVMPWNFPLWQVIRMAAPTIMAGNTVVYKHAPNVPGCALYIENLFTRAGFPAGVLTSVFAEVEQVPSIIANSRVAAVTLTGSDRAGRSVAAEAGKNLKKVVLELGGSDPFIVASSADLDHTIPIAVTSRVQNNGQACIASKRYIVVKDRAEEFIARFTEAMASVVVGDPMEPATVLGPLVSATQHALLVQQVADSVAQGAIAHVSPAPLPEGGYYYPATVLEGVAPEMPAGCQELFGPVAVVHVVDDLDAAIALANDTPWGLSGTIWATDQQEIDRAIAGLDVGMVFANAMVASMPELPFGGTKASGYGRELGNYGIREFTNVKSYYVA